jgi:hypothetical protein
MLGGVIYLIFLMITTFFDVLENVRNWSFMGLLVVSTIWSISFPLIKYFKGVESDRVQNKKNIIQQYFYTVPKDIILTIILSILYGIPFLVISGLFYFLVDRTSFYRTVCLPILGGIIGEMIWGFLFILIFGYIIYVIYKPINKLFYK